MKKIMFIVSLVFVASLPTYGDEFPIFKLPPNLHYNLFNYSYTPPSLSNKQESKKLNYVSKELKMNIYGIFVSDGKRVVLINDKILKEGDKIDGYLIKKITDSEVIFSKGNRNITKKLALPGTEKVIFDNNTIKSK